MKVPHIRLNENPTSRSRDDACGQTDTTKLIGAVRAYADAPKRWLNSKRNQLIRNKSIFNDGNTVIRYPFQPVYGALTDH